MKEIKIACIILLAIFILVIALFIPNYMPTKFAIHEDDLQFRRGYIVVETERSTGCEWVIVTEDSGNHLNPCVELKGNMPPDSNPDNTFVCYGEFTGMRSYPGLEAEGEHRVFNVVDWDVLYPVKHAFDFVPSAKSDGYLNVYDWRP